MQIRITKPGQTGPNPALETWYQTPKEYRGPRPAEFVDLPIGTILTVLPEHGEIHIARGYAKLVSPATPAPAE